MLRNPERLEGDNLDRGLRSLAPGEQRTLTFTLGPKELQFLTAQMKRVVDPGAFRIMIGASSRDIRLRGQLVVR
jgi:beta-glucosidase